MMSVSEYASDVGKTVSQIIELCKKLIFAYLNNELSIYDSSYYYLNDEHNLCSYSNINELQYMNYDFDYLKLSSYPLIPYA